ncbi:MAG: putative integral rane protein [Microbacteriaceae bacterium]|jgi:hypothetical protein|nr:putative integral rane protein [Microbacteriaceae bacterium]
MAKAYAVMLGVLLGSHAFVGWFIEGERMLGVLNVDTFNDIVYTLCAVALLFVGSTHTPAKVIQGVLLLVGALFVVMGIGGTLDEHLGGLLPSGTTIIDHLLLFGTGGAALLLGVSPRAREPLTTNGTALN